MPTPLGVFGVPGECVGDGYQGLPTLTDSEVQAALNIGLDGDEIKKVRRYCDARAGFGETLGKSLLSTGTTTLGRFRATMSSNIGEIALIAYEKKRKYQPVGLEDVPAELREPAAFISIAPLGDSAFDGQLDLPSLIEHVIVRPQGDKDGAVQPLSIETNPTYLQNLFGAVIAANTAVVSFPAQAIYEIAQNDDVEIVVITPAGRRSARHPGAARTRLAGHHAALYARLDGAAQGDLRQVAPARLRRALRLPRGSTRRDTL